MSLRIHTNVEAFNAHRNLVGTEMKLSRSMERLSSGFRIIRAADDSAGLAISEKLRAQIGGIAQSQRNAQDAVSLVGTAEGALAEVHSMLSRVRDLAVQFNNGTLSANDKAAVTAEIAQLCAEVARIGSDTAFNGLALLTGNAAITFQVGAQDGQTLTVNGTQLFGSLRRGSRIGVQLQRHRSRSRRLTRRSAASRRCEGTFGSVQNRLEHTLKNLSVYEENLQASESRIRDVDMAQESVQLTKFQILQQAGLSMLAQATASPQAVLSLLR